MNSIAQHSPIVREMIWRIISEIEIESTKDMHRIDSDVVPHISQTMHMKARNLQESILQPQKQDDVKSMQHTVPFKVPQRIVVQSTQVQHAQPVPIVPQGYGKLAALINDPTITHIKCKGPETQVIVVRRGREQSTGVKLTQDELSALLRFISERARIPLTEGIFKVDVDNMLFHAITAKEVGTTLIIKKNFQISPDFREAYQ
jgi:hypothetical protein